MRKEVLVFIVAILCSFLVANYLHAPDFESNGLSSDKEYRNDLNETNSESKGSDNSINWWKEDDSEIRYLKENFCQTARSTIKNNLSEEYRVCLNRDGFRDRNFSVEKPENSTRVIALGDAVTFGIGVENNETWPSYLEKDLQKRYGDSYQVLNFGFPFKSTKEEVIWFNRTSRKYDPDIVVLQYMPNDAQNISRVDELEEEISRNSSHRGQEESIDAREQAIKIERMERKNMSIDNEMETVENYLGKLERFSREDDFNVFVFYHATEVSKRHLNYLNKSVREKGWILTVSDLNKSSTFGNSFYLNSQGNKILASDLSRELGSESYLQ